MECPECEVPMADGRCPNRGLDADDVAAAADFWDDLSEGVPR